MTFDRRTLVKSVRVVLGGLMLVPLIIHAVIWDAVNREYHPDTYDPARFWANSAVVILPLALLAAGIALWRFDSQRVGYWVIAVQLVITMGSAAVIWSIL